MIELTLIGIGTGNPEHMTLQAIRALNRVDLVMIPKKGPRKGDLAGLRRAICEEMLTDPAVEIAEFDLPVRDAKNPNYKDGVDDWHDAIADVWTGTILSHLGRRGKVALLVWGDPSLYDSTLRIAGRVHDQIEMTVQVIPGITSMQALTATHAIPVNEIGAPFTVTTGRNLRDHGWPEDVDTLVIMLDGECSFRAINPEGVQIWWSAYAGMANEIALSGPLADVADTIIETRAKAREEHGWIMDIYLLRRDAGVEA